MGMESDGKVAVLAMLDEFISWLESNQFGSINSQRAHWI